MDTKHFAVILSGCGVLDGAEIHEATILMLAIKKAGHKWYAFAPDQYQADAVNHCTGEAMPESRNVMVESARIARQNIEPLDSLAPESFDAIILPGGFGVAKNLCSYAREGENFSLIPALKTVLDKARELGKPVGATCIAPILLPKIYAGCRITLGNECQASEDAVKNGAVHQTCTHGETVVDERYKLVTTPAYMLDADIAQVAQGIENMVAEILKLV
ncbi:MAG: isoprenoid biosynthesis glyoxalase ElbB [Prevotellaceae bacterium]|jgi:enhancing lycopene biosynthesis protein 2|nr:isoprenoid biosynthesis glyoxalase ElbB [Prevotellaceae bacterium]